jgi:hypothetical protein
LHKVVQVQVVFTWYHHRIGLMCQSIDFFHRDLIDLVITLESQQLRQFVWPPPAFPCSHLHRDISHIDGCRVPHR